MSPGQKHVQSNWCVLLTSKIKLDSPQFDEELESLPSLATWSSKASSYESWVPYEIPDFPDDATIEEWSIAAEGAHGQIRKVRTLRNGKERVACFKLFNSDEIDAYHRELNAYALLIHRGVKRCIPQVYFKREWPRWKWDGNQVDFYGVHDRDEILYGIVMEYFEDFQEIEMRKADLHTAELLGKTFERILDAGVIHNDIEERNILLVRESGNVRIVWIDFSCAWSGTIYLATRSSEWDMFRGFLRETMVQSFIIAELLII